MAAAALSEALPGVIVRSCGTHRTTLPVDPHAVSVCADRGLDIAGHVPRSMDADLLRTDGADLIVTMTREQLRDVATTDRRAWGRCFTLREAVRRSAAAAPCASWEEWLGEIGRDRSPRDLLGAAAADDVADPYGFGIDAVKRTGDDLWALAGELASTLRRFVTPR